MAVNDISKKIKQKNDAQWRAMGNDQSPIIHESQSGEVYAADPQVYTQELLQGKNITITIAGGKKTINAVMGLIEGSNISISAPDANGKITITGNISGKGINITDFTDKDGYVLSYNATSDKFELAAINITGGTDAESLLTKPINITDFAGKDGHILAYNETSGEFYLKKDEAVGGGGYTTGWTTNLINTGLALSTIIKPVV